VISWYSQNQTISTGISASLTNFGSEQFWGLPRLVYLVIALVLASWYLLNRTPFGRRLYGIGANVRAARLVGVRVGRDVFSAFVIAGVLSAIAGILLTAREGSATADPGTDLLFPAIAAVFLGATVATPGRFNVIGTVIGVLFVATSVSGLTLIGAADWVQPVFNGCALLVAVSLSTVLRRRRTGSADLSS
jgi:ribose transport system permease protein